MPDRYPWKRFWVPRDGVVHLDGHGYMIDPEGHMGDMNPDVLPFAEIKQFACLGLLGEPGIGKTFALGDIVAHARKAENLRVLHVDLRSYSNQALLYTKIFESPEWSEWVNSTDTLEVFLDSLDECAVHVRTVSAMLIDELKKYPRSRLRLRVVCRTGEWPPLLEQELPKLWGDENYGAFELTLLRRKDVNSAAQARDLVAEDFLQAVEERDVVPMAIKPITLEMLLDLFEDNAQLPGAQHELYWQGCLELCRDPSRSREASGAGGVLTPGQRLAIAARIAALTVFGKRVAIQGTTIETPSVGGALHVSDIVGGEEPWQGGCVPVDIPSLKDTLQHAQLFSGRQGRYLGWAHWSYAEYLAAVYLTKHKLRREQICDLLLHPGAEDGRRVVPQLAETAAWFAGMRTWFLDAVLDQDPQVLLRSAVIPATSDQKRRLTDSLLRLTEEQQLSDAGLQLRRRYDVLNHPGIAQQLRPVIADKDKGTLVRRVAIDIAESCNSVSLLPQLLHVTLDTSDDPQIRAQAAHAILEVGEQEDIRKLKALLRCTREEDPQDNLRGTALRALWPEELTAKEVFEALALPQRTNYFGIYQMFIDFELVDGLQVTDLPVALRWVADQPRDRELPLAFRDLLSKILRLAWRNLDNTDVLTCFADVALARLRQHEPLLGSGDKQQADALVNANETHRRHVLVAILLATDTSSNESMFLAWSDPPLAAAHDLPWILEELEAAQEENLDRWGELARAVFDWRSRDHVDSVVHAGETSPAVRGVFSEWLEPVEIDSERAAEARKRLKRRQEIEQPQEDEPPGLPRPFHEILLKQLEEFEGGDVDAWWRLNLDMTIDSARGVYQSNEELEGDLRQLPGWQAMNAEMQTRTVDAAAKYLEDGEPHTDQWIGTNTIHRPAFAGYRAARLLLAEAPHELSRFSAATWAKWAPIIVAFPEPIGTGNAKPMERLVARAYTEAPKRTTETLLTLIDKENEESKSLHILHKFKRCWDRRLCSALQQKAEQTDELRPEAVGDLLDHGLRHGCSDMREYAILLVESTAGSKRARALAREAAAAMLKRCPAEAWPAVWDRISTDEKWGMDLFTYFAHHHDRHHKAELGNKLVPNEVAKLYVWLHKHFPPDEDPDREGPHFVGGRETVAMYRDAVLAKLRESGATNAIRQIRQALPGAEWLVYTQITAESNRLRRSWEGVEPRALLSIFRNAESRLVESPEQLLQVLVGSLKRLDAELQGAPPAVRDLWNTRHPVTPKDEPELSDYIARHLEQDLSDRGIVANREVQIRPIEQTDIKVDALRPATQSHSPSVVSVIMEVKGCWHRQLQEAMRKQLRDRYMAKSSCTHGLYVVGWFLCDQWDNADYRKAQTPKWSLRDAHEFFARQAEELKNANTRIRAFVLNTSFR